jgi:outer membrane protein insertion porin family
MNVHRIVVDGNVRMRQGYFEKELSAFDILGESSSIQDLSSKVSLAIGSLQGTGLFEAVEGSIVVPPIHSGDGIGGNTNNEGDVNRIEVHLRVKEKGIPFLEMGTYARAKGANISSPLQEGQFELDAALRSPLGYGEWGKVSFATSRMGARDLSVNFRLPHVGTALSVLNLKGAMTEEDRTYFQSFRLSSKVLSAELGSRDGKHQFEWSWMNRDEVPRGFVKPPSSDKEIKSDDKGAHSVDKGGELPPVTAKDASGGILASLAASTKMAFKYTGTLLDTRDVASDPSQGSLIQGTAELSLPPGTAQFIKSDMKVQAHRQIGPPVLGQAGMVVSLTGNLGLAMPLGALSPLLSSPADESPAAGSKWLHFPLSEPNLHIPVADRFSLGGPLSLRGFDMNGVGPRSFSGRGHHLESHGSNRYGRPHGYMAPIGDSLGGVGVASAAAILSVPLPFRDMSDKLSGVRAFTFLNIGSLGNPQYWAQFYCRQLGTGVMSRVPFWGAPRASAGGGISVAFAPSVRLELTYSVPLLKSDHDSTRGFQIGLGMSVN